MNAIRDYLGLIPDGWETRPIEWAGVHYGDIMLQGNEIHVAISPDHRLRCWSRRRVRQFVAGLLSEKHFLTTRSVPGDDTERFIQRLGFVKTNGNAQFNFWWCDTPPFEKGKPCKA